MALVVFAGPSTAAAGTLDQEFTGPSSGFSTFNGSFSQAQTFTAGLTGELDQVDLVLSRIESATAPMTLEIRRGADDGCPSGDVLASVQIAAADVPDDPFNVTAFLAVPLPTPVAVVAGEQYAIVLSNGAAASYSVRSSSDGDPYPGGKWCGTPLPSTSWAAFGGDLLFRTYVAERVRLTVSPRGDGSGFVTSSPAGIDCGRNIRGHRDCEEGYAPGTAVTLTARARGNTNFDGWSGACAGVGRTCTVTMEQAQTVIARFDDEPSSGSDPAPPGGEPGNGPTCRSLVATIVATRGERTTGTNGADVIVGTAGRDRINAGPGDDVVCARGGDDRVRGQGGDDTLRGQGGFDKLFGGGGPDDLGGGPGVDRCRSGLLTRACGS